MGAGKLIWARDYANNKWRPVACDENGNLLIVSEVAVDSGVATGGTNNTLQDTTKDWEVNMWEDAILEVEISNVEYHRFILSNTADTLTFNALPGVIVVAANCPYAIKRMVNPLSPLSKANQHNVALVGMPANILVADLTPTNIPCLFRTQVAFDVAGVFSTAVTSGGVTVVTEFNHGVVLPANSLFMFDMLVHTGDSINFRYGVNCNMLVLRVQEVVAAVQ